VILSQIEEIGMSKRKPATPVLFLVGVLFVLAFVGGQALFGTATAEESVFDDESVTAAAGATSIEAFNTTQIATGQGEITVTATDGGSPVSGETISVDVDDGLSNLDSTVTTDSNGNATFTFNESATGTYTIEFSAEDSSVTDTATVTIEQRYSLDTSSGDSSTALSDAVVVDDQLTIGGPSNDISAARVTIQNKQSGDQLSATEQYGITSSYDSSTGVLNLTGTASPAEYQEVLRSVEFQNTNGDASTDTTDRNITISLGNSVPSENTGHYYQFISNGTIDWDVAQTKSTEFEYFGLQGYLVTVTSQTENDFVAGKLQGQGWMGASDRASEGTWKWVTGPEAGDTFPPTNSPDQSYDNWNDGEPNDSGGEDRAHFRDDATWNDYSNGNDNIDGYVVEYGGLSTDPTVDLRGTKTVTLADQTGPTYSDASKVDDTTISVTIADNNDVDESTITKTDFQLSNGTIDTIVVSESGTDADVTLNLGSAIDVDTTDVDIVGSIADTNGNTLTSGSKTVSNMDGVAPSFGSGYPTTSNNNTDGFDIDVQADEGGTAYYVVVEDDTSAPSVSQIQNGNNADGTASRDSGSVSIAANTEKTLSATGLSEFTDYDVYVVVEDSSGNARKSPVVGERTTASSTTFPIETAFDQTSPASWTFYDQAASNTQVSTENEPALRLTDATQNEKGTGLYGESFPTSDGVTAQFRYYANDGSGADGFSFMLLNASQVDPVTFETGASGGSLGYSGDPDNGKGRGVPGGFLGIGFDEWGNFANSGSCHDGGTGIGEDPGVTIRGAGDAGPAGDNCGDTTNNYPFLEHSDPSQSIDGGWRDVRITVDPTRGTSSELGIRVAMSFDGGNTWETVVDNTYSESAIGSALPERFYLGFSGSTGGSTNVHAIDDLSVTKPVDLATTVTAGPSSGPYEEGDTVEYTFDVSNNGPNDDGSVTLAPTVMTGTNGLENIDWDTNNDDSFEVSDADSVTISLDGGDTQTITLRGTVGSGASSTLDHEIGATTSAAYNDPDPTTANDTVTIAIQDAPTMSTDTRSPDAIGEDDTTNSGTTVSTLLSSAGTTSDDEGDALGVAITAVDDTDGTWEYSTDGGSSWQSVSSASPGVGSALLLAESDVIRFVPDANVSGTAGGSLTVRAWDQKTGAAGNTGVDTTTNGGSTAFSSNTAPVTVDIDDAPEVSSVTRTGGTPTNASSVDFQVTFDESVTGVDTGDVVLTSESGDVSGTVDTVTGSGATYTVTVDSITGDGVLGLAVVDDDSISNGNDVALGGEGTSGPGDGGFTGGESYTFDNESPSISSFSLENPQARNITVRFESDEQLSDIAVVITGEESVTLTESSFTETDNGDGTFTYNTTVDVSNNGVYDGVVQKATDSVGNDGGLGQDDDVTVDAPAPEFTIESLVTTSPITAGDTLTVTATITNTGDKEGQTPVEFAIYEFTDSRTVSLGPGESETATFEWNTGSRYAGEFTAELSTDDDTATKTVLVQGDAPVVESAVVADETPNHLTVTFEKFVEVTNETAGLTVTLDGTPVELQHASSTNQIVTLRLGTEIGHNDTLAISYDNASQNIQGTDGTLVPSFSGEPVTNNVEQDIGVTVESSASSYLVGLGSTVTLRANAGGAALETGNPTYTWEIDGETVQTENRTLTWTFDQYGAFDATVSVEAAGETDTDTLTVTVEDRVDPSAQFTASETVTPGEDLAFDATVSSDNVAIDSYEWEFGDGTTASGDRLTTPTHSYDEPGVYEVSLTVTDTSGNAKTNTQTVTVDAPDAVIDTDTRTFGSVGTGSESTQSIALRNNGTTALSVTDLSIEGADSAAFSLDTATLTVNPGATKTVGVTFAPASPRAVTDATLVIETNNPDPSTFELDLTGEGVQSSLQPVSGSVSLGDVDAGETTTVDVEFTNTGTADTSLTNATLPGDQVSLAEDLPVEVPAGETVAVTVAFEPTESAPTRTSLHVETTDGDTASVTLTGEGIAPDAYYPTETLRFGEVRLGDSETAQLQIRNDGSDVLTIDDVRIGAGASDAFEIVSAPEAVQPDETATITVEFAPEAPNGQQAELVIPTNDPADPTKTLSLEGTGQGANVDVNPRVIDFGGESATARITVTNRGDTDATLTVGRTTLLGTNPGDFEIVSGQAPFELAPGESRDIVIEFTPQAIGQREAQLQIRSDAGNEQFVNVWLTNTRSYIIVEDVSGGATAQSTTTSEGATTGTVTTQAPTPRVKITGTSVESGNLNRVNVSSPSTLARPVTLDTLELELAEDGDFKINIRHSETAPGATFDPSEGRKILQYIEIADVDVSEELFEETGVEFVVDRDDLAAGSDPADITLRRYDEASGQWETLDVELLNETDEQFRFRTETTMLSEFVVTAPAASGDPQLLVDDVTIPAQAPQDSTIDIVTALSNPGASSVTQDVTLTIDGTTTASQSVSLDGQTAQTRTFEYELGTYEEIDRGEPLAYYDEDGDGTLSNNEIFQAVQDWQREKGYFAPVQVGQLSVAIQTADDRFTETVPVVDALTSQEANNAIFALVQIWQADTDDQGSETR
jgi:PGF-pre-PGF domain-containing protein